MRKIKVGKWTEPVNEEGKLAEREVTLLNVLSILVNNKKPEDMPRGFDKFRMFSKITKAFEKAEKNDVLELEDAEYLFLKKTVESDIPATWGSNPKILEAVEAFMEAKGE